MYTYQNLERTSERQEELLTIAQEHLRHLKDKFPEVGSMTLYLKHPYGHSTMKVFLTKQVYERTGGQPDHAVDPLIEKDFSSHPL